MPHPTESAAPAPGTASPADVRPPAVPGVDAALSALLFETAGTGVAVVDGELRYVRVNATLAAMNSRSVEAHEGRRVRDVLPGPAADAIEPLLRRVIETGEPVLDLPFAAATPRGPRHFLSTYYPTRGADGSVTGLVALVAEHLPDAAALRETLRESEAELHAREAQLLAVLEHLPVGVIIAEAPSGRVVRTNAQADAILGRPAVLPRDVEGYGTYVGFHPADGRPYEPDEWPLARAARRGETVRGELVDFRRRDGTPGTLRVSATPIRDAAGHVDTAVVLFDDISAQRAAEAAERAARAEAERAAQVTSRIATHLADGICMMDAGGRLTYMNPAAERILGWHADELLGDVLHDRVHYRRPDGRPFPIGECPLGQVLSQARPVLDLADQWIRKDGSFVHVVTTCSPIVIDGRVVGAVLSLHDDTERRRVEAERERLLAAAEQARAAAESARAEAETANRAKAEFLAVMSHELRTPLNAIGGYAELIELGIRGPVTDEQREDLARIQASQRHLLGLINEVLNYARLETGSVRYDLAAVPVRDALVAAEGLMTPQARAKGVPLQVAETPPALLVRADDDRLRQIVVNLLSNAVKFTDRGGTVVVSCAADGALVRVHVRDTGIGIAPDKLQAVFEPFVQVRADLTRPHEGTGLGLAISRDLAWGMGGDLTAVSTPGVGSTFTLTLPRA